MIGLGTIVNVGAVVAAGLLGVLLKGGIKERFQSAIMGVLGISTMFIGAAGTLQEMFTVENGSLSTRGTMLLVLSLIIGAFMGELLNIEARLESWVNGSRTRSEPKMTTNLWMPLSIPPLLSASVPWRLWAHCRTA